jgi:hypothetical protein
VIDVERPHAGTAQAACLWNGFVIARINCVTCMKGYAILKIEPEHVAESKRAFFLGVFSSEKFAEIWFDCAFSICVVNQQGEASGIRAILPIKNSYRQEMTLG